MGDGWMVVGWIKRTTESSSAFPIHSQGQQAAMTRYSHHHNNHSDNTRQWLQRLPLVVVVFFLVGNTVSSLPLPLRSSPQQHSFVTCRRRGNTLPSSSTFLFLAASQPNGEQQQQPPRRKRRNNKKHRNNHNNNKNAKTSNAARSGPRSNKRNFRKKKTNRKKSSHRDDSTTILSSSSKERVAIIGGGVAGLSCAHFLAASGRVAPVVFDTGRLRPGGRCSSRWPHDRPKDDVAATTTVLQNYVVDHAAQILTVPPSFHALQQQVDEWEGQGICRRYPTGSVYNIVDGTNNDNNQQRGGVGAASTAKGRRNNNNNKPQRGNVRNNNNKENGTTARNDKSGDGVGKSSSSSSSSFRLQALNGPEQPHAVMYYGTHGMGSIPLAIRNSTAFREYATIHQDVWVSPSRGIRYLTTNNKWQVRGKNQILGTFDRLVIAHNGKCADRLTSQTPATRIHQLLRVNFAPRVAPHGGNRMTLNSIYSLTIALPNNNNNNHNKNPLATALPEPFVCGFVRNEPTLRFLTCHTRKFEQARDSNNKKNIHENNNNVQVWTILSSATFAKKHKAPQEFLPPDVQTNVTQLLLAGVERSLGLPFQSLQPLDSKLQLWGAAVPLNVWESNSNTQEHGGRAHELQQRDPQQHQQRQSPPSSASSSLSSTLGFLYDGDYGVGVCGDWLLQPSIAGAWESGRRLALSMTSEDQPNQQHVSRGLEGSFRVSPGAVQAGLGSFV